MSDPLIGTILNDAYRLDAAIGAGGMGKVYRATRLIDPMKDRQVAVKVLSTKGTAFDGEEGLSRFRREAELTCKLGHPHIVEVIDFDMAGDEVQYIVMELLQGEDLKDWIMKEGPLPVSQAVPVALQAAAAMQAVHTAGVIHRDLKPSNIFLNRTGEGDRSVKILDFGLSKQEGIRSNLTKTNEVVGSVWYMSPEQAQGLTEEVAASSDVFSLGSIIYHMLTGQPPFHHKDLMVAMMRVCKEDPPPMRKHGVAVPEAIEAVVLNALLKDRSSRYASMEELARALTRAVELDRTLPPLELNETLSATRQWAAARPGRELATGTLLGVGLTPGSAGDLENNATLLGSAGDLENNATLLGSPELGPGAGEPLPAAGGSPASIVAGRLERDAGAVTGRGPRHSVKAVIGQGQQLDRREAAGRNLAFDPRQVIESGVTLLSPVGVLTSEESSPAASLAAPDRPAPTSQPGAAVAARGSRAGLIVMAAVMLLIGVGLGIGIHMLLSGGEGGGAPSAADAAVMDLIAPTADAPPPLDQAAVSRPDLPSTRADSKPAPVTRRPPRKHVSRIRTRPRQTGILRVVVHAGGRMLAARISINGKPAGESPLSLNKAPAGTLTVRAEHKGYKPSQKRVRLHPGTIEKVIFHLRR